MQSAIQLPATDPTAIFEHFRGNYGCELLAAAVGHFPLFAHLATGPLSLAELRARLGLAERPAQVLLTALRSMKFVQATPEGKLDLTPLAREHLVPGQPFYVGDYVGLSAESPGVLEMVARLRTNRPAGADKPEEGAAFIYKEGAESAMEKEASARHFTLALAGRAKNVAPHLAARLPVDGVSHVLDVGGGTGIYSMALLQKHPRLRATILDRPEVLKVAAEMAAAYGVANRLTLVAGDMFTHTLGEACDAILLSNILHDWDVPQCQELVTRCARALRQGGQLWIHDVFLDDDLGGPLAIALYSAALFSFTEGRAYSAAEYRDWLRSAGLTPQEIVPTFVHCGVLTGMKDA